MPRAKKEFVCSNCGNKHMKWEGICRSCKQAGTLEEVILAPATPRARATTAQKKLQRRSKDSERSIARRMLEVDGPDPMFKNIASSTGRIGFITGMRIDAVSKSYVTENKNRKLPVWLIKAWELINQRAIDFDKNALLHIEPPNMPREIPINGTKHKLSTLAIITQTRHEELIKAEKALAFILSKELPQETLDQVFEIMRPSGPKI